MARKKFIGYMKHKGVINGHDSDGGTVSETDERIHQIIHSITGDLNCLARLQGDTLTLMYSGNCTATVDIEQPTDILLTVEDTDYTCDPARALELARIKTAWNDSYNFMYSAHDQYFNVYAYSWIYRRHIPIAKNHFNLNGISMESECQVFINLHDSGGSMTENYLRFPLGDRGIQSSALRSAATLGIVVPEVIVGFDNITYYYPDLSIKIVLDQDEGFKANGVVTHKGKVSITQPHEALELLKVLDEMERNEHKELGIPYEIDIEDIWRKHIYMNRL